MPASKRKQTGNQKGTKRSKVVTGTAVTKTTPVESFVIQQPVTTLSPNVSSQFNMKTAQPTVPNEVVVNPDEARSVTTSETLTSGDFYEELRKKGRMGSASMLDCDLVSYVRNDLFPKLKFVMDKRQLQFSTEKDSICFQICSDLGLTGPRASAWWEIYKNKLVSKLNSKRADISAAIKRVFMSKSGRLQGRVPSYKLLTVLFAVGCNTEEIIRRKKRKEDIPELKDIQAMSSGGDTYNWICEKLLKCVVGSVVWNKRFYKDVVSNIATVSDESFLLLVLENNYARWMEEADYKVHPKVAAPGDDSEDETWKENIAPALYTNSGKSQTGGKGSNRRCGGWSRAGCLRFNVIYSMVKEDRKTRANFELALKQTLVDQYGGVSDDSESEDEADEIVPANDMAGVRQPVEQDDAV
jgi:hypothetical protein